MPDPNFDPTSDTEAAPDRHQHDTEDQMTDAEIPDDEAIYEWDDPVVGYIIVEMNTGMGDQRRVFAKEIVQGPGGTQIGGGGDGIREHYELPKEATIVGTIPAPDGIFQRRSEDEPHGKIRTEKIITPGGTTIRRADQPEDDE